MNWSFSADTPIYLQLIRQIEERIIAGIFPPGSRLPAVRELAAEAEVNPNTMQRAMAELEREGLVYSQRTAGRFVTEDLETVAQIKRKLAWDEIHVFLTAMNRLGYTQEDLPELLRQFSAENHLEGGQ